MRSISSKSNCFSSSPIFILEDTKFIAKDEFLIFLIAIDASLGIFGEASIIFNERSLTEETKAVNSLSLLSGLTSFNSIILAL